MKKFYLLCAMAFTAFSAYCAGYRTLSVNQTDGTSVLIGLTDELSAYFENGMLQVYGVPTQITVSQDKIKSFSFLETSTIDSNLADKTSPVFDGQYITFSELAAGSKIDVIDAAGRCISSVNAQGSYTLNLSTLVHGVYFVSVNGVNYKIVIK